jgi:hypothetical protein
LSQVKVLRARATFGALVFTQAAHSVEEYVGRLWETFPPARLVSGLISSDRELGFIVLNMTLVAFGVWCFLWPVRGQWRMAGPVAALWVGLELINGVGHPLWSLRQGVYTPGVATAPILFVLAILLARQLPDLRSRSMSTFTRRTE